MDALLGEKMKALLADPQALSRVMEVASRLMQNPTDSPESDRSSAPNVVSPEANRAVSPEQSRAASPEPSRAVSPDPEGGGVGSLLSMLLASEGGGGKQREEERIALLGALCPFLNPGRREAAQSMIRILKLLSMADAAGLWQKR